MKVIPNLKYTDKHEWVKIDGEFAYIGITAYAQNQLGEVLFVEMPEVGDELNQGEEYGVVESSKVASDLIAPLSGEVVEINERLDDEPEDELNQGEEYGVVESSKVASDLIAPLSGEVVEINERLDDEPEYINEDPYDAWIVKVKIADEDELENLLNSYSYEASID